MGSMQWFSRRDFLKTAGAFSVFQYALWMGGCESCQQQIAARPTRRNISNLPANDPIIQAYQAGVAAMKAKPASDPLSWAFQADIHANHCPHGNWWWLPWHRAFLVYFERIIRKLSGHDDFALPYWNWTTNPSVPAPFWGNGSSLFDPNRGIGPTDTPPFGIVDAATITGILGQTNFNVFASYPQTAANFRSKTTYGLLEASPHNQIHPWIGGLSGDMTFFHSPLDPIFWCHHNILDCLWYKWNEMGNANTNDPVWNDQHFTEFFDETGTSVDVVCAITPLFPLLTYQFEPCNQGPNGGAGMAKALGKDQLEALLRKGAPVKLDVTQRFTLQRELNLEVGKPARSTAKIESRLLQDAIQPNGNRAVLLNVNEITDPDTNDYFVRVFVGKPDATPETPTSDSHYAGSFGFFNDAKSMANMPNMSGHKFGFVVDLTPALRSLNQGGGMSANSLDVTLIPVGYPGRKTEGLKLSIGNLELGIAQIK